MFCLRRKLKSNSVTIHKNLIVAIFIAELTFLIGINRTEDQVNASLKQLYFRFTSRRPSTDMKTQSVRVIRPISYNLTTFIFWYSQRICRLIAIVLHYFFCASFSWMFVEGLHMYRRLREKRNIDTGKMSFYYFMGWGKSRYILHIDVSPYSVGIELAFNTVLYPVEEFIWRNALENEDFSLSHARVMLINPPFTFHYRAQLDGHALHEFS